MAKQFYVFLVRRPIDTQAWPCIPFDDQQRAIDYPNRCSPVIPVMLQEHAPLNVPPPKPRGHWPQCQCESCIAHRAKS